MTFTATSFSQGEVSVGLKFGYGFSRYYFVGYREFFEQIDQDLVPVYEAGLIINHFNEKNLGMQLEVLYAQKGWQENFADSATTKVVINYLEIPLMTEYRLRQKSNYILFKLGVYGAYAIDAEITMTGEVDSTQIDYNQFTYSNFDFGLKAGLGYELRMGRGGLQLMLTYTQSFWNVLERDREGIIRSLNQGAFVSCIYNFSFTRKKNIKNKIIKLNPE